MRSLLACLIVIAFVAVAALPTVIEAQGVYRAGADPQWYYVGPNGLKQAVECGPRSRARSGPNSFLAGASDRLYTFCEFACVAPTRLRGRGPDLSRSKHRD